MPTSITTINSTDLISASRTDLNNNFASLNTNKIETSVLDTDTSLTANSDLKVATQKATKAYVDSVASPTGKSWNEYAAANSGTDSYTIAPAGVTAYVIGQTFKFKADVANTGAATLNVNGLGAKTIKKNVTDDLSTGDILANQLVIVTYDGTNMQFIGKSGSAAPVVTLFTASGTYTKTAGIAYAIVELVGGGGGGAGNTTLAKGSGGGGGGGYSRKLIAAGTLGATETVTIGAAGTAGGGAGGAGGNGGTTSFGAHLSATGGSGATSPASNLNGGAGGMGSGGNINTAGGGGGAGNNATYGSGAGGSSHFGGGGYGIGNASVVGVDGGLYGGGGSGAASDGSDIGGGAGAPGVVIVTEYF